MQGVIDFLISDEDSAKYLRNAFVFKIVPMQNPDGVIVGNYRCSLMGCDLNRMWTQTSVRQYPVNTAVKAQVKKTQDSRELYFFCDFHGHSTGKNIFIYGNNQSKKDQLNKEKVFPL